ncbi:permease prefix domain 1-containing protein [Paenibacillus tengchongensis]|uniref:permease prefix domain 1-containing protein n=1 Tax=Paenibacillus tengchongensis TaxID=2608684 RepID=UPI00124CEB0B|nr:permease prefix domain 1-containing protein [Paenibacillus tengchongensis]
MDTIMSYLNNMFAALPRTEQTFKLKQDLLAGMEEKYYELKQEGKSENEAVGIVISEFGNIEELAAELGIAPDPAGEAELFRLLSEEEATEYMSVKKRTGFLTGIGVALCLTGVSLMLLFNTLVEEGRFGSFASEDAGDMLGLVAMFLLLVPAVGLFIYSGMKQEKYSYLQGGFELPYHMKREVERRQAAFAPTYTLSLILGVCLCILSVIPVFAASAFGDSATSYAVIALLEIIAMAVFLFVYYGNIRESHTVLLKKPKAAKAQKEEERVIGAAAAVVWPLATCIFLVSGFVFGSWHINWVIFPVTGILFGMFCAFYNIVKGKESS